MKTETKENTNQEKECHRVRISAEANEALVIVMNKVTEGFTTGTIHKSDIANYVFLKLDQYLNENDFKILRSQHFDDRKVLYSIFKNSGQDNDLPEDIKKALREHYGINEKAKKSSAKTTQGQNLTT